ncbi:hypothetical protein ACQ5SP_12765 [Rhodovulum sp. YNF3179]|uniref:hypothetical protein n=1 Tax=Rhodovulum sp. YNF3179 TaxID=3425127 RepID=UPI003D328F1B
MRFVISVFLAALLLAAPPARAADPVPGQDDAGFVSAVETWLEGDEAAALPVLADLAAEGNTAAQMLLALVDKMPELQGPWLSDRSRDERVALLRAPGGMSGKSWMRAAAAEAPLARLWVQLWSPDAPASLALGFARAGEARAAREALVFAAARQAGGFDAIADDPDYPAGMRYLVWKDWRAAGQGDRVADDAARLSPGDPQRVVAGLDWDAGAWPDGHVLAAPLEALCAGICPDAAADCARAGLARLGGYEVLAQLGTPAAVLIPRARFLDSAKGRETVLRRMLLSGRERPAPGESCLDGRLAAEAARY